MNAVAPIPPWSGPFGGLPPLDRDDPAALEQLARERFELHRAAIESITAATAAPTFDNTIAPLEAATAEFWRALSPLFVHLSTRTNPALQKVERKFMPELAALEDEIIQNAALFARIDAVRRDPAGLDAEQRRLVARLHLDFTRAGAGLGDADKSRLSALNQELSALYTAFAQAVLADEQRATVLTDPADLAGLSEGFVGAAAQAAADRGLPGAWAIVNTRSAVEAFLGSSPRRDLRERVWREFSQRGSNSDEHDTTATIARVLTLRRERAALLGHPTHAHWAISDQMAGAPRAALDLLLRVAQPAADKARAELADLQAVAGHDIAPWDSLFYRERVRRDRYAIDDAALKPYFALDAVREAAFACAGDLFGLSFLPLEGVPVPHPTVRAFEVRDSAGHVGVWYFDPFARPSKRSGAWMTSYRTQHRLPRPSTPVVVNVCNFLAGADEQPALLSFDDARTLFHEFGHALHGLLSSVSWPRLSGTSVPRDFVELPSQLFERWIDDPSVLRRFARHHQTGAPLPEVTIARLAESRRFGQGLATCEFLASAMLDLELHLAADPVPDAAAVESAVMGRLGLPSAVAPRHRPSHFLHIFAGEGYAAMYYAYLWADMLVADAAEAFTEAGSMFDRPTAQRLRETILCVGGTIDAAECFRTFRGRDPLLQPLLRERGFGG
jgi:peptidyl-dipeptidase Dcp